MVVGRVVGMVLVGLSWVFGMFNSRMIATLLITSGVAVVALAGSFWGDVMFAGHDDESSRTALTLFAKPVS